MQVCYVSSKWSNMADSMQSKNVVCDVTLKTDQQIDDKQLLSSLPLRQHYPSLNHAVHLTAPDFVMVYMWFANKLCDLSHQNRPVAAR